MTARQKEQQDRPDSVARRPAMRRALVASVTGQMLEWYDFYLYGLAASLVFPHLFFPGAAPLAGTLASFGTFAVGFVARPLGGLLFGNLGDRMGRRPTLTMTLLLMGVCTVLLGLLPSYDTMGIAAPILLIILRIGQGIGVGGEWGGATVLVIEFAPERRRGFFASITQSGEFIGLLVATGLFTWLSTFLPQTAFEAWGWRIPFLLSVVVVVVSLAFRLRLAETPVFEETKEKQTVQRRPLRYVLVNEWRSVLFTSGLRMFENGSSYVITAFALTYATSSAHVPENTALLGVLLASVVAIFLVPVFGSICDRVGRKPVYVGGAVFLIVFYYPFFLLIGSGQTLLVWSAFALIYAGGMSPLIAAEPSWFSELFPTNVRYSGASIGYQVSAVFAGGLAPFIATSLLAAGGGRIWLVLAYIAVLAVISLITAAFAPETYRRNLHSVKANTARSAQPDVAS